jgi:hypothetical protein
MKAFDSAKATGLFERVMESVRAFECVKEQTHTFGLYNYSAHRALLRRAIASTLLRQLQGYGFRIDMETAGSTGAIYRFYTKLRSALAGGKRSTVRELVRGETELLHIIEVALATTAIPEDIVETLSELHHCVADSKLELTKLGVAARRQRYLTMQAS